MIDNTNKRLTWDICADAGPPISTSLIGEEPDDVDLWDCGVFLRDVMSRVETVM